MRTRYRRREVGLHAPDGSAVGNPWDRVIQASSSQMPVRRLDKAEMKEIVRLAIAALNERQRMAVLLSKFEGMSYADIAQTMELSPPSREVPFGAGPGQLARRVGALLGAGRPAGDG